MEWPDKPSKKPSIVAETIACVIFVFDDFNSLILGTMKEDHMDGLIFNSQYDLYLLSLSPPSPSPPPIFLAIFSNNC